MSRNLLLALITLCLTVLLAIAIVGHNSTARFEACVKTGNVYVKVPDTSTMQCVGRG